MEGLEKVIAAVFEGSPNVTWRQRANETIAIGRIAHERGAWNGGVA